MGEEQQDDDVLREQARLAEWNKLTDEELKRQRSFSMGCVSYMFRCSEWEPEIGPEVAMPRIPEPGPLPFLGIDIEDDGGVLKTTTQPLVIAWRFFRWGFNQNSYCKPYLALALSAVLGAMSVAEPVLCAKILDVTLDNDKGLAYGLIFILCALWLLYQRLDYIAMCNTPDANVAMDLRNMVYLRCKHLNLPHTEIAGLMSLPGEIVAKLWRIWFTMASELFAILVVIIAASLCLQDSGRAGLIISAYIALFSTVCTWFIYQSSVVRTAGRYYDTMRIEMGVTGGLGLMSNHPNITAAKHELSDYGSRLQWETAPLHLKASVAHYLCYFQAYLVNLTANQLQHALSILVILPALCYVVYDLSDAGHINHTGAGELVFAMRSLQYVQKSASRIMDALVGTAAGSQALLPIARFVNHELTRDHGAQSIPNVEVVVTDSQVQRSTI